MRRLLALLLIAACGTPNTGPSVDAPTTIAAGACGNVTLVPDEPGLHVPVGTAITWSTNPPATGKHYPMWAQLDRSYLALDRGYWMHDAEHGSIILLYNCPDGCDADVAALQDVVRGMAIDHACTLPVKQRALVVSDPLLPTRFGAVAWDVSYTASCVDSAYLAQFAADHYNHGPEDLCNDGAALGGSMIE